MGSPFVAFEAALPVVSGCARLGAHPQSFRFCFRTFSSPSLANGCHWDILFTSYIPALATLVAAFYGAKYAFEFQRKKDIEEQKRKDLVAANITIFNLMRMANSLLVFRKQVIDPFRGKPTVLLEIPAVLHTVGEDIKITPDSLYFLLKTKERNLLGEILIEERRYNTAIQCIEER
jgi:hypothetical protein